MFEVLIAVIVMVPSSADAAEYRPNVRQESH
jgi:hypothetical protein